MDKLERKGGVRRQYVWMAVIVVCLNWWAAAPLGAFIPEGVVYALLGVIGAAAGFDTVRAEGTKGGGLANLASAVLGGAAEVVAARPTPRAPRGGHVPRRGALAQGPASVEVYDEPTDGAAGSGRD